MSYRALTAPSIVAPIAIQSHRECFIEKPSRAPRREMKKSDAKPSSTPAHWSALSRSPNTTSAPTSTITGREALMGP